MTQTKHNHLDWMIWNRNDFIQRLTKRQMGDNRKNQWRKASFHFEHKQNKSIKHTKPHKWPGGNDNDDDDDDDNSTNNRASKNKQKQITPSTNARCIQIRRRRVNSGEPTDNTAQAVLFYHVKYTENFVSWLWWRFSSRALIHKTQTERAREREMAKGNRRGRLNASTYYYFILSSEWIC